MAGKSVRADTEILGQFDDLVNVVTDSCETLTQVAKQLHSLAADEAVRTMLIEHRREEAVGHLAACGNAAAVTGQIKHLLQFFASPSRKTLQATLADGDLDAGELVDAVETFDRAIEDRVCWAGCPEADAEVVRIAADPESRRQAVAGVTHEDTDQTPSEIADRLGMSRSQVYEAIHWFRGLHGDLQMAIRRAAWGVGGSLSGPIARGKRTAKLRRVSGALEPCGR